MENHYSDVDEGDDSYFDSEDDDYPYSNHDDADDDGEDDKNNSTNPTITELPFYGITGFSYFDDEKIEHVNCRGGSERIKNVEQTYACTRCSALLDDFMFFCAGCSDITRDYFCESCIELCGQCNLVFCDTCTELTTCDSCDTILNCQGHFEKAFNCCVCTGDFCSDCLLACGECNKNEMCEPCSEKNRCFGCKDVCCKACRIVCEVCNEIFCRSCLTDDEHICEICGMCGKKKFSN